MYDYDDDDDNDIFANVNKFCNTNILEEIDKNFVKEVNVPPVDEFNTSIEIETKKSVKISAPTRKSPVRGKAPRRSKRKKSQSKLDDTPKIQENVIATEPIAEKDPPAPAASSIPTTSANVEPCAELQQKGRSRNRRKNTQAPVETARVTRSSSRRGRGRGRSSRGNQETEFSERMLETLQHYIISNPPEQQQQSQRGRAYRNYVAEKAARSTVVDSIDLITSPSIPLPNISTPINLDSDESCPGQVEVIDNKNLETSFNSENPEISVKIKWNEVVKTFNHRKYQKFADIMKAFAEKENVGISDIFLTLNDRIIQPNDTPDSIDYKIFQFISGRIITNALTSIPLPSKKKNSNHIDLKIQSDAWKKPLVVSVKKEDTFRILYIKCSEELKVPCEQIKLSFDGDLLVLDGTPNDLELEGGEIIDCRLSR